MIKDKLQSIMNISVGSVEPSSCEILLYFYMQLNALETKVTDIPFNLSYRLI